MTVPRKVGALLLTDAMNRAMVIQQHAGAWGVLVNAIDEDAASFYEHFGFTRFDNSRDRLYFALKDYLASRG